MESCINVDADTGFQFYGDVVIPDGYLFDPASHQRFVKFGEVGSLLCDIILQVIDPLYLLIPCGSVYGGLLAQFPKPEYFIGNFVIGFVSFRPYEFYAEEVRLTIEKCKVIQLEANGQELFGWAWNKEKENE